jgi:outer membrane protein assembly factor BamB
MKSKRSLSRSVLVILLAGLLIPACAGESARYQSQAGQFMAEGRLPEAVLTYRQALSTHPEDPNLWLGLGTALAAQGRQRSAGAALDRAARLKPADASIQTALGELVTRPEDGLSLSLAWFSPSVGSEPVGAAAADGRVFVAYTDGRLRALDQASGRGIWEIRSAVALTSPPAADSGQVWVGAEDGSILVFEATSGRKLGSYLTGGAVLAAPALSAEAAYFPSNDGTLYALGRTSLDLLWKAPIGTALRDSPVVGEGVVYVGSNDGRLYAFKTSNGERLWPYGIPTQGAVEGLPSLADGRIYFGSGDGRVYALDAETGGQYWRFSTPDAVYAAPLVVNDQVIVASSGLELASLQASDGKLVWSLSFDHPITAAPAFFKGRLYLATRGDPHLFAVDFLTGKLLGSLDTGDWIAGGPLASGTDLLLVGQDGGLFLYR